MRAQMGLAKTGGIASNGSGDYVIAFSTNESVRISHNPKQTVEAYPVLHNDYMSPLFMATIEATEEAIINSLFAAKEIKGYKGYMVQKLPQDSVVNMMKRYNRIR